MKKKYILLGVLGLIILPSLALASWWNPFGWFKKKPVVQEMSIAPIKEIKIEPEVAPLEKEENEIKKPIVESKKITPKPVIQKIETQASVDEFADSRSQLSDLYAWQYKDLEKNIRVNKALQESQKVFISGIKDKISGSEGFKIGNPDISDVIDFFIETYNRQLSFEIKYLNYRSDVISWMTEALSFLEEDYLLIGNLNKQQLLDRVAMLEALQDAKDKTKLELEEWEAQSSKIEAQIDGMIAGFSSYSSPTNNYPSITITPPPTYVPPTPSGFKCYSKTNFIGELETTCY